jgi:hypothetical protein
MEFKLGAQQGSFSDFNVLQKIVVRQAGPIFPLKTILPFSAKPTVFDHISLPVFLTHMKNINKEEENAPGASEVNQGKKADVTKLPRLEMYVVLGLELNKKIFEKLEEVEKSVEIIARQKARELNTESREANAQ